MNVNNLVFFDRNGESYNFSLSNDGYWEGHEYFLPISLGLFDVSNIFILEKSDSDEYSYPIMEENSYFEIKWKTQDSKDNFFLFTISRDGIHDDDPQYLNKQSSISINHSDFEVSGDLLLSYPLQVNVAFTPNLEKSYTRVLEIYYNVGSNSTKVLQLVFYGEGEGEDERYKVWLENFGIKFNREDALLLKDYDLKEGYPDWKQINTARKSLLVNIDQVYPYIGTYKALVNIIKLLGYSNVLKVKEYWQDSDKNSLYYNNYAMVDITELMNIGDFSNINLVDLNGQIKKGGKFKKTEFLALTYQFTQATDTYDDDGLPEIESTTDFSVEEIFFKLKGIEYKLKEEILPINVVIKDVIGEFIYFSKFNLRNWSDTTYIESLDINEDYTIKVLSPSIKSTLFKIRDIKTLYPKIDGISQFPVISFNAGEIRPYDNNQIYSTDDINDLINAIYSFYDNINDYTYRKYDQLDPSLVGADSSQEIGCPIILEAYIPDLMLKDLDGLKFSDFILSEATTSSTLNSIGTGLKYFSCATTQVFDIGSNVKIYSTINPSQWMEGTISEIAPVGYTDSTIKVNITSSEGNVVGTGWTITLLDTHYVLDFLKYKNAYEIEWIINGPNNYEFKWRDSVRNIYKIPHILPYSGKYTILVKVYDMHGSASTAHKTIEVIKDIPFLKSFVKIHDKSKYTFENLQNVTIKDLENSPLYKPFASIVDLDRKDTNYTNLDGHYLDWNFYSNHYSIGSPQGEVEIYNNNTGEYEKLKESNLSEKYQFGTGSVNNQPTLADYNNAILSDLKFVTFEDLSYSSDIIDGFYIDFDNLNNASPNSYLLSLQYGGFNEVSFPILISSPSEFIAYIESANLPGWKNYRYEIFGNRVKATAILQDKKNHSILKVSSQVSGTFNNSPYIPSSIDLDISSIDIQLGICTLFQSEMIGASGPFWQSPSGPWWPGPSGPFYEWDNYSTIFNGPSSNPSLIGTASGPYWITPSGLVYYGPSGYDLSPSGPVWGGPSSTLDSLNEVWPNPSGLVWPYSTNWLFPTIYSNTNLKLGDRIRIKNSSGGWAEGTILTISDYQIELDIDKINKIGNFINFDLSLVKTIYTFNEPINVINTKLINEIQSNLSQINKELDRDLLFLDAPFSDYLNDTSLYTKANASNIEYWINNGFVSYDNALGIQTGYLPSSYDENSLNIINTRIFENTINALIFTPVFIVISNSVSSIESIWTLTKNNIEIVKIKTPSYFIWKFDKIGKYSLSVTYKDARGNITTLNTKINVVNSMSSYEYSNYIEEYLDNRKSENT